MESDDYGASEFGEMDEYEYRDRVLDYLAEEEEAAAMHDYDFDAWYEEMTEQMGKGWPQQGF